MFFRRLLLFFAIALYGATVPANPFLDGEDAFVEESGVATKEEPQAAGTGVFASESVAGEAGEYEYRIGPQDLIEIEVFQSAELGRASRVNSRGYVSLPLLGSVNVGGLTIEQAERLIEKELGEKYLQDPHVTIFVREYESQKITVEGWVKNPGVFPLKGKTTFLQAIANAKGMDRLADFSEVALFRAVEGKGTVGYLLSYTKVRSGVQSDPVLQNGDIIVVNRSGSKAGWELFTRTLTSFVGWSVLF